MIYQYRAANYCYSCGRAISDTLDAEGVEDTGDSEDYPQPFSGTNETDSPEHCASESECQEAIDLREYAPITTLHGAESYRVGALLTDELTDDGRAWLTDTLAEPVRTEFQHALWLFWSAVFEAPYPPEDPENDE